MQVLWLISNDHLSSAQRSRFKSENLSFMIKMSPSPRSYYHCRHCGHQLQGESRKSQMRPPPVPIPAPVLSAE